MLALTEIALHVITRSKLQTAKFQNPLLKGHGRNFNVYYVLVRHF